MGTKLTNAKPSPIEHLLLGGLCELREIRKNRSSSNSGSSGPKQIMVHRQPTVPTYDAQPLTDAFTANRRLQYAVLRNLRELALQKANNRAQAAKLTAQASRRRMEALCVPTVIGNPYRHSIWKNRGFFTGPDGSTPPPNPDTLKRRKLEQESFYYHLQPPWSSKESNTLSSIVQHLRIESTTEEAIIEGQEQQIDFLQVAEQLQQQRVKNVSLSSSLPKTALPRTAEECRVHYEQLIRKRDMITKAELQRIVEQVEAASKTPDWFAIGKELSTATKQRTGWECFLAYQNMLRQSCQSSTIVFTAEQDELLLKYVAAMGPQLVLDGSQVAYMAANIAPDKPRSKIFKRLNTSLLNPKLKHDAWSDEEERKLAIVMKMYKSSPGNDLHQLVYHLPGRSMKSVVDKWHRTLNPVYSTIPFTAAEDEALLQAARQEESRGRGIQWVNFAHEKFPKRHPQRLQRRYLNLNERAKEALRREYQESTEF